VIGAGDAVAQRSPGAMVVCRAMMTTGRSEWWAMRESKKNRQIQLDRRVEAVFWCATGRDHISRARGKARIVRHPIPER